MMLRDYGGDAIHIACGCKTIWHGDFGLITKSSESVSAPISRIHVVSEVGSESANPG